MTDSKSFVVRYGDNLIPFERITRRSVSKRILIKVHPDCRVIVSRPEDADNDAVISAVKKRGRWIYEQLRDFRKLLEFTTPRQYISGASHDYLGKQYLLKVLEAPDQAQSVKLPRGKHEVSVRSKSTDKVRELLTE